MQRILFLDDCNGFEGHNPNAYLVEVSIVVNAGELYALEKKQIGAGRMGGKWRKILEDGNIPYTLVSSGKKSQYKGNEYSFAYTVISGNY